MSMATNLSGQGSDRFHAMGDINVTPLVDIMLVLLIIFMVTAPLMTQGVEIDLPQAESKVLAPQEEPLVISVAADGMTYIEERAVPLAELGDKVMAIRQANPEKAIYVRGDLAASYGAVMVVMAGLQQAGVERVGLLTEQPG
ncbi:MAG: protein TolR [Magnetococcales bacterium]|nr:protein TolR [Magnetococcales bacterium]